MVVEDVEEIEQLKYRYLRTLDLERWEELAEVFVPTETGDRDLVPRGRGADAPRTGWSSKGLGSCHRCPGCR